MGNLQCGLVPTRDLRGALLFDPDGSAGYECPTPPNIRQATERSASRCSTRERILSTTGNSIDWKRAQDTTWTCSKLELMLLTGTNHDAEGSDAA